MPLTIPVVAPGVSAEGLAGVLDALRSQGIDVARPPAGGLGVDPGTVTLIVEVAKVTLPALLSAVATIWAAKIGKGGSGKPSASPRRGTRLVLELDASEVSIDLDASGQPEVPANAPSTLEEIVRIRLER
jgi:hypothetical protein